MEPMSAMRSATLSLLVLAALGCTGETTQQLPAVWPPQVGATFPDLELFDHRGEKVRLSSFEGKVLLIKPVGMSCAACNAFNGGNKRGTFPGASCQADLEPMAVYVPRFANGLSLDCEDIVVVEILFFNLEMQAPSVADAAAWSSHYGLDQKPNHVVLVAPEVMRQPSYDMIPGYLLVDRDFVLRKDASGHHPVDDLYQSLIPAIPEFVAKPASEAAPAPR